MAGVSTAGVFFGNLAIVGLANSTNGGYDGAMTTVSDIADTLGRGAIAQAVGVRATAVSNAVARDKRFPPSWFLVVSRMCSEAGIECPPDLFGMKVTNPSLPQSVDNVKAAG